MNDDDRVRLATRSGDGMLGPIERERCAKHPRRWTSYRWVWDVGGDISGGEPVVVRSCAECLAEDRASEFDE